MRTAVVPGGDAATILEPAKQALNEVTALVKLRVADNRLFTVGAAWNTGLDATFGKGLAPPQPVSDDVADAADDFSVIDPWDATHLVQQQGLKSGKLSVG